MNSLACYRAHASSLKVVVVSRDNVTEQWHAFVMQDTAVRCKPYNMVDCRVHVR